MLKVTKSDKHSSLLRPGRKKVYSTGLRSVFYGKNIIWHRSEANVSAKQWQTFSLPNGVVLSRIERKQKNILFLPDAETINILRL
jgi:hypothetical protein